MLSSAAAEASLTPGKDGIHPLKLLQQENTRDPVRKRMELAKVQGTGLRRRGALPFRGDAEFTTCHHRSN